LVRFIRLTCGARGIKVGGGAGSVHLCPEKRGQRLLGGLPDLVPETLYSPRVTVLPQDEHTHALLAQGGQHLLHRLPYTWGGGGGRQGMGVAVTYKTLWRERGIMR